MKNLRKLFTTIIITISLLISLISCRENQNDIYKINNKITVINSITGETIYEVSGNVRYSIKTYNIFTNFSRDNIPISKRKIIYTELKIYCINNDDYYDEIFNTILNDKITYTIESLNT